MQQHLFSLLVRETKSWLSYLTFERDFVVSSVLVVKGMGLRSVPCDEPLRVECFEAVLINQAQEGDIPSYPDLSWPVTIYLLRFGKEQQKVSAISGLQ